MNNKQVKEFFERLEGKEGCAFEGMTQNLRWKCAGGKDKTLSIKILKKMKIPKKEATSFLNKVDSLGGHCDCEIIFNAKDEILRMV